MRVLTSVFERLGLVQYLENFINEGFDTWDTVLDITESDLDALNVKLGHRRKLQREIAHAKGISIEQVINTIVRTGSLEDGQPDSDAKSTTSQNETRPVISSGSKRKYRRHPKPDENAPERPPSAYVIFSNKIREELRPLSLSFTEIAKAVGERWQMLQPEGKEPYESQAAASKEAYNTAMATYKRTQQYQDYQQYLAEFKARYGASNTSMEGKRAKLEPELSTSSNNSGVSNPSAPFGGPGFSRKDSAGTDRYSPIGGLPSHSTSPLSAHRQRLPTGSQSGTAHLRSADLIRPSPLPRILPLENRDGLGPHDPLGPIPDVQVPPQLHPRRSTRSPASLLRHDTSKSSVESTFSAKSGTSSLISPVTPVEEPRVPRALQPLVVHGQQYDNSQSNLQDLAAKPGASPSSDSTPVQAAAATWSPEYDETAYSDRGGSRTQLTPLNYAKADSSHWQSSAEPLDSPMSHGSQRTTHHDRGQSQGQGSGDNGRPSRLDALSVLALAGRLVDDEQARPVERK